MPLEQADLRSATRLIGGLSSGIWQADRSQSPRTRVAWKPAPAAAFLLLVLTAQTRADPCDEVIARIRTATGAVLVRRIDDFIALRHPLFSNIELRCDSVDGQVLTIFWSRGARLTRVVEVAARIGEIALGVDGVRLRQLVSRCHAEALRTDPEPRRIMASGISVECDAPVQESAMNWLTMTARR